MKRVLLLLVASLAVLAACADNDDEPTGGAATVVDSSHNDADVSFARDMVPHHAQAIEMARLAVDRAESDDVKKLASEIEGAKSPRSKP